jgi:exocyst complex component 2
VRILLTLSNIQSLKTDIMPHLLTIFETTVTIKLTEDSASIRDALAQIDHSLFDAYVSPLMQHSDALIRSSIARTDWAPRGSRPTDASPYVYNLLLGLVLVHSEINTTTSPLTSPTLKHLLESYLKSFLEAFKTRPNYSRSALMQATLDVEFLAQTLSLYTTAAASATQSDIYVQLDQLTDNDARVKLQQELKELKGTLKKLREGTRTEL